MSSFWFFSELEKVTLGAEIFLVVRGREFDSGLPKTTKPKGKSGGGGLMDLALLVHK